MVTADDLAWATSISGMAKTGSGLPAPRPYLSRSSSSASVAPPADTIASDEIARDQDRLVRARVLIEFPGTARG
jgi:hypothetical protein